MELPDLDDAEANGEVPYPLAKRLTDKALASALIVLLLPAFALIAGGMGTTLARVRWD